MVGSTSQIRRTAVALLFSTGIVSSCITVPQYDQPPDTNISALQKEIDTQLVQWLSLRRPGDPASLSKASYQASNHFYNKVEVDLTFLELRIEAVQDRSDEKHPAFFSNMRAELASIQAQQRNEPPSAIVLVSSRNQLNAQFA